MKQVIIQTGINDEGSEIATLIKTRGFQEIGEIEKILIFIGLLENLKQEQLNKLKNLGRRIE